MEAQFYFLSMSISIRAFSLAANLSNAECCSKDLQHIWTGQACEVKRDISPRNHHACLAERCACQPCKRFRTMCGHKVKKKVIRKSEFEAELKTEEERTEASLASGEQDTGLSFSLTRPLLKTWRACGRDQALAFGARRAFAVASVKSPPISQRCNRGVLKLGLKQGCFRVSATPLLQRR